jgi:KTSC domain
LSDDGCGCIVALAVVGVVGYGAWAYLQPQAHDTPVVDAPNAQQVRPIEEAPPTGPSAPAAVPASPPREACSVILRTPVTSSMIRSIGYCRAQRALEIEFTRGTVYRYWGVSQGTYDAFLAAPSKGQFFNAAIRNQPYGYARVR